MPTTGAVLEETALQSKLLLQQQKHHHHQHQHQLPDIDFSGERESPRKAAPGGDRGGGRGGSKPPPKPSEGKAVSATREPAGSGGGGGGEDEEKEGGESGEETTSVDGEEDFLALPVESAESERNDGGSGSTEGEEVRSLPRRRSASAGREGFLPRQQAGDCRQLFFAVLHAMY